MTTPTRAIARVQPGRLALEKWGEERLQVLKEQIAPGASDAELDLFAAVCERTGLDAFARQIWSIQRRQFIDGQWVTRQVIQIGVHGLRLVAARTREYQGQVGPFWCGPDGKWVDVWMSDAHPKAARVGVKRKGFSEPVWSVAVWDRAVQADRNGNPMALWKTRGPEQLALAAERDALRRAFPLETADMEAVVDDEAVQANSDRYTEIFGDEEHGTAYDLDRGSKPVQHNGRTIDAENGEVLEDNVQAESHDESAFKCVECGATVMDQTGSAINANQRDLLLQRFGKVICRTCRAL